MIKPNKVSIWLLTLFLGIVLPFSGFSQDPTLRVPTEKSDTTLPKSDTTKLPKTDTIRHFPAPIPDTIKKVVDTSIRIRNLNPYFTLHVDSTLYYQLDINKDIRNYFWYLKNSPIGLKINKDNGLLTFRAEKSYFL